MWFRHATFSTRGLRQHDNDDSRAPFGTSDVYEVVAPGSTIWRLNSLQSGAGEPVVYLPRIVDAELQERLAAAGAVVIEGPKACGKTETARQRAASAVLLDVDDNARRAAEVDPSLVLDGAVPRLLDEWQVEPSLWNHVRRAVDDRGAPGQFILTGSAVPADDMARHTGAGRFSFLRMRPMTLYETGHANGAISVRALLTGEPARAADPGLTVGALAERITVGGWPAQHGTGVTDAARAARDYLTQIVNVDVSRVAGSRRDPIRIERLLRSLARNTATEVAATVLATDAGGPDGALDRHTVVEYLTILERLMVIEDQPAWAPHLRSRANLRTSPKRHFVDPSLAVAALGSGPQQLLADLNLLGLLFESLVVRDLRVLAQPLDGRVLHYRDNYGVEADAIVQLVDGRWAAFEIKLGAGLIEEGAASLLRFRNSIDVNKSGPPAVLGVITGNGYGYRRPDRIDVIPIGALGP
jgi:predicted AAA+ superfamily ATPase